MVKVAGLATAPNLTRLALFESNADDSYPDAVLLLKHLENVDFERIKTSAATYDALTEAGVTVDHYGLKTMNCRKTIFWRARSIPLSTCKKSPICLDPNRR